MSTTINPTNFELENQQHFYSKSYTAKFSQAIATDDDDPRVRIPANLDAQAINAANRIQDIRAMLLTALILVCIIASGTCLIVWLLQSLCVELSRWSPQDYIQIFRGH